jgi:hypothetical protein
MTRLAKPTAPAPVPTAGPIGNPIAKAQIIIRVLQNAKMKAEDDALKMEIALSQRIAELEQEIQRLTALLPPPSVSDPVEKTGK